MYQQLDEWTDADSYAVAWGAAGVDGLVGTPDAPGAPGTISTLGTGLVAEPAGGYAVDLAAYSPHTHRVIGCAMRVHALLGSGFPEVIYQRALGIELEREQVVAQREVETPIYFRGQQIGTRRVDFLVAGPTPGQPILVELKAGPSLTDAHFAQIINYLEAYRLHVGLLLNFGAPSLQYRRLVKTNFAPQ